MVSPRTAFLAALVGLLVVAANAADIDIGRAHKNTTTHTERYGPFTAMAEMMSEFPGDGNMIEGPKIPAGFYGGSRIGLVSIEFLLTDEDGNVFDQDLYLHHYSQYTSKYKHNLLCPQWGSIDMVVATSAQFTPVLLPFPYAIPLEPGETFNGYSMVMNYHPVDVVFYIQVDYIYVSWTDDLLPVRGAFFDVTSCEGDADYDTPDSPDSLRNYRYLDFPSPFTGTLVSALGHLHRGGQNVYLANRETGEVLFSGRAHYDDPDHPDWISRNDLHFPMLQINAHDKLRMVAIYDNKENLDVMGTIFAYVHVTDQITTNEPLKQTAGTINPFDVPGEDEEDKKESNLVTILIFSNIIVAAVLLLIIIGQLLYQNRHRFMPATMIVEHS